MESPGTAPGSDPLITSAFMFIVPRDRCYISVCFAIEKGHAETFKVSGPFSSKENGSAQHMDRGVIAENDDLAAVFNRVIAAPVQFGQKQIPAGKAFNIPRFTSDDLSIPRGF